MRGVRRERHCRSTWAALEILLGMQASKEPSTPAGDRGEHAVNRVLDRIRRLFAPPRIVAIERRPAGWFAVSGDGVRDVLAWARYADDQVVGLVADRRGLRRATGPRFHGYLPGVPRAGDVQLSPPVVAFAVADLVEAIGDDLANPWTSEAQAAIYSRLRIAARAEWASAALLAFVADPEKFCRRHLEMLVEHGRAAELDEDWRAGLAAITEPPAHAGIEEDRS